MNLVETDVKMIHEEELFKLVAFELNKEDPTEEELAEILKNNEIKVTDVQIQQS